jgi:hypothetical protein
MIHRLTGVSSHASMPLGLELPGLLALYGMAFDGHELAHDTRHAAGF